MLNVSQRSNNLFWLVKLNFSAFDPKRLPSILGVSKGTISEEQVQVNSDESPACGLGQRPKPRPSAGLGSELTKSDLRDDFSYSKMDIY